VVRFGSGLTGAELAAAPSVAGSSGPRRAASRRRPATPLLISKRRERKSSCGRRSPARWRTGPRRSAASRDPLAAPAVAPVATWRATITTALPGRCVRMASQQGRPEPNPRGRTSLSCQRRSPNALRACRAAARCDQSIGGIRGGSGAIDTSRLLQEVPFGRSQSRSSSFGRQTPGSGLREAVSTRSRPHPSVKVCITDLTPATSSPSSRRSASLTFEPSIAAYCCATRNG
jgi:hypothetical protein